jgi:hypothetical protein
MSKYPYPRNVRATVVAEEDVEEKEGKRAIWNRRLIWNTPN